MKKLIAFVVVLGLAAIPVWLTLRPPDLGVSKADPFGSGEKIEAWLRDEKLVSSKVDWEEAPFEEVIADGEGLTVTCFRDAERARQENVAYSVWLARDRQGKLRAFAAQFFSGQENAGDSRSRPQTLVSMLWKQMTGADPKFVQDSQGEGMFFRLWRVAKIEKDTHQGFWKKEYLRALEAKTIFDVVVFWRS